MRSGSSYCVRSDVLMRPENGQARLSKAPPDHLLKFRQLGPSGQSGKWYARQFNFPSRDWNYRLIANFLSRTGMRINGWNGSRYARGARRNTATWLHHKIRCSDPLSVSYCGLWHYNDTLQLHSIIRSDPNWPRPHYTTHTTWKSLVDILSINILRHPWTAWKYGQG